MNNLDRALEEMTHYYGEESEVTWLTRQAYRLVMWRVTMEILKPKGGTSIEEYFTFLKSLEISEMYLKLTKENYDV